MVVEAYDLHRVQVDDRDEAVQGSRVLVVGRVGLAEPGDRPHEPSTALLELARRPRLDVHEARIRDAPLRQRLDVARVVEDDVTGEGELVAVDRGLHVRRQHVVRYQSIVVERDHRLDAARRLGVEEHDERLAGRASAALAPGEVGRLVRLAQLDRREAKARGQAGSRACDGDGAGDLIRGQRVERVAGGHCGSVDSGDARSTGGAVCASSMWWCWAPAPRAR